MLEKLDAFLVSIFPDEIVFQGFIPRELVVRPVERLTEPVRADRIDLRRKPAKLADDLAALGVIARLNAFDLSRDNIRKRDRRRAGLEYLSGWDACLAGRTLAPMLLYERIESGLVGADADDEIAFRVTRLE